ncbi:MAG: DUF2516 family protein [Actinomycetes bacterium]
MFNFGLGALTSIVVFGIWLFTFAVKAWALVDVTRRRQDAFPAVDRLTKVAWLVILGLSAAFGFVSSPLSIFSLAGDVAAGVYLLDVRPKIKAITGGRW